MTGTNLDRVAAAAEVAGRPRRDKSPLNADEPVGFFAENERGPDGTLWSSNTVLLTNRECPFRCVYCDLWKHTLDVPTPAGAIPRQIDFALERLPDARQIKLYNAGNFFDAKAIPAAHHQRIAERLRPFDRVVIENHPKLCDDRVARFRDRIDTTLEVAIGVESVDPAVLTRLDKALTLDDLERATGRLQADGIPVRAFLLFPPPFVTGDIISAGVESVRWSLEAGCEVVVLIPLRTDSGTMPQLVQAGEARAPTAEELRNVALQAARDLPNGRRLFVDLWDAERLFGEDVKGQAVLRELTEFNHAAGRI